eukprot:scaffold8931_cov75-Isochrysis_galbana.AAC.2
MVEWGATTGQVHGCAAGKPSRTARYPPQATRPPRLPEPSQAARRQRAHLNPAQGRFGNVMLRLIRIRSPRVVSTYKWSVVVGVRYDRNSEMTSTGPYSYVALPPAGRAAASSPAIIARDLHLPSATGAPSSHLGAGGISPEGASSAQPTTRGRRLPRRQPAHAPAQWPGPEPWMAAACFLRAAPVMRDAARDPPPPSACRQKLPRCPADAFRAVAADASHANVAGAIRIHLLAIWHLVAASSSTAARAEASGAHDRCAGGFRRTPT